MSFEVLALLVISHADVAFLVMFRDQTWAFQLNGTGFFNTLRKMTFNYNVQVTHSVCSVYQVSLL